MRILQNIAQMIRRIRVVNKFKKTTFNPSESQKKLLLELITTNKNTFFGIEHSFSDIKNVSDYQRLVPLRDYEGIRKYIDKIRDNAKQNILTKEDVELFGITSGSTGAPKFVPVTKSFIEQYKDDWDIWTYFAFKDHPSMLDGKILVMVSPEKEGYTKGGIPYGSISGLINNNQTKTIKKFFSLPYSVYQIKDYDAKYYTILRIALEQDISLVITPNPSMILLLCKKIEEYKDELISDIESGTLSRKYYIEENIRLELEKMFKPNYKRAHELREINKSGKIYPKDIWKKLSLIGCWKEGTLPIFLKQFPEYFGDKPIRDIGLIATEGQSSITLSDDAKGGVLSVNYIFFEFIPVKKSDKEIYLIDEILHDKEYFLVITTKSGLYRYNTNDKIKVVGFFNKTPIIQFLHKGEHVASITGEKITEWQVVHAMRIASNAIDVPVGAFTLCAQFDKNSRYDILLSLHKKCETQKLKNLISMFDDELKRLNIEYKKKRDSQRLGLPKIKIVKEKEYEKMHRTKVDAGAHDSQVKITSLTDDAAFEKQFKIEKVIST